LTLSDLIEDARKNPGKLSAAALAATQSHLGLTLLKQKANVDITFVPFPGTAPIITALLGSHVTAMVDNYGGMAEQVNAGKLRVLATLSRVRIAALSDVPTVAEAGYPGIEMESWFGVFAPANMKSETRSEVTELISSAIRTPDIRPKIEPLGLYPSGVCGSAFSGSLHELSASLESIIRNNNIQAE
jgi:tripartite-type tricarboxylate transporter receptor subunit TctC